MELLKKQIPKKHSKKELIKELTWTLEYIDTLTSIEAPKLEETLKTHCQEIDWKLKELFMPLRIIVTGVKATPPLFETMEVLGKEKCRRRIKEGIQILKTLND